MVVVFYVTCHTLLRVACQKQKRRTGTTFPYSLLDTYGVQRRSSFQILSLELEVTNLSQFCRASRSPMNPQVDTISQSTQTSFNRDSDVRLIGTTGSIVSTDARRRMSVDNGAHPNNATVRVGQPRHWPLTRLAFTPLLSASITVPISHGLFKLSTERLAL